MDIQTRKLNLISYVAQLQDEIFIKDIEDFILAELGKEGYDKPFSMEELNERINH